MESRQEAKVMHFKELIKCKKYLNVLDQVWQQMVPTEPNKESKYESPLPEGQEEAQDTISWTTTGKKKKKKEEKSNIPVPADRV